MEGEDLALDRTARTEGDDRCAGFPAEIDDLLHLFGAERKTDRVGGHGPQGGLITSMLLAFIVAGGKAFAQSSLSAINSGLFILQAFPPIRPGNDSR